MSESRERLEEFVSKLYSLTNEDKIRWDYLESNSELYDHSGLYPYSNSSIDNISKVMLNKQGFDPNNSFYASINSNYILIFTRLPAEKGEGIYERLQLWLVPRTFKAIEKVGAKNNVVSLLSIIKSKFPSSSDIINDVLELSTKDIF